MRKDKGFTLIEAMIVAAIIGIVVAIVFPKIAGEGHVQTVPAYQETR